MEIVGIVFTAIVVIVWMVLHHITKWKSTKGISVQDEVNLTELRSAAERLEDRIRVMERILDDEVPDWKDRK